MQPLIPSPIANSQQWHLHLDPFDATQHEKIIGIPGLRVQPTGCTGYIDAVAAACFRLKRQLPVDVRQAKLPLKPWGHFTLPPRPYQIDGIQALRAMTSRYGGALLADDMGLGKSRQAIELMKLVGGRNLIVCPRSVAETWRDEVAKWAPNVTPAVLGPGKTKKALAEWEAATTAPYVITSYEMADRALSEAFFDCTPDFVVMDEAHLVKGRRTQRSIKLRDACTMAQYRLGLTGTPIWSRPRDFYMLLSILFGNRFGKAYDFDMAYCGGMHDEMNHFQNKGATNTEELKLRLSYYMVRREKREVLKDLPSLTRQIRWLDATPAATRAFMIAQRKISKTGTWDALAATLEGKVAAAVELACEAKRFLLFTYMKSHAHTLQRLIAEAGTPCGLITGDMSVEQRAQVARDAVASGHGIVATLDSAGVGLNLQGVASIGIFHALSWIPLQLAQAEARLHRLGQTENVTWIYLAMKESADAMVVNDLVSKLDQWRAVIGTNSNRDLRDDLNSHIEGAGADEELRRLYESM